jgi:hypothetical protein
VRIFTDKTVFICVSSVAQMRFSSFRITQFKPLSPSYLLINLPVLSICRKKVTFYRPDSSIDARFNQAAGRPWCRSINFANVLSRRISAGNKQDWRTA